MEMEEDFGGVRGAVHKDTYVHVTPYTIHTYIHMYT